jgi:hypothetical protein
MLVQYCLVEGIEYGRKFQLGKNKTQKLTVTPIYTAMPKDGWKHHILRSRSFFPVYSSVAVVGVEVLLGV